MSLNLIRASDGTGEAVRASVTAIRAPLSTTINVDAVTNWPDTFVATTGDLLPSGALDPATVLVFKGSLSGATIVIDTIAPGYTDNGSGVGDVVILKPSTLWADNIRDTLAVSLDDDGTLKAGAVDNAAALASNVVTTAKMLDANVTSEKLSPTVGFYATSTANINATQSLVTVYTEVADYGSDFASGVFTAPVTGLYNINIMGQIDNVTADNRFVLFLYKNTSTYIIQSMGLGVASNHDPTATIALNIPLAADDTLGVQAYSEGGTKALNPLIFSGYLVGKV